MAADVGGGGMNKYRVRSGQMNVTVRAETEVEAIRVALARKAWPVLGRIIEVTPAKPEPIYYHTERMLERFGIADYVNAQ